MLEQCCHNFCSRCRKRDLPAVWCTLARGSQWSLAISTDTINVLHQWCEKVYALRTNACGCDTQSIDQRLLVVFRVVCMRYQLRKDLVGSIPTGHAER